ncbi:MAG: phage portal protein [Methanobrevibacter sp.]|nr:phage portal protein [Methanobrevibacter sp.]
MAFWERFKKREDPSADADDVLLRSLLRQETITREKAMTIPSIAGAVDFISGSLACMPVKLFKYNGTEVEEVKGDPRCRIMNQDTGDTLDGFQLKKAMVEDYLMGKGGYAYIQKKRNEVTGVYYVQEIYIVIMRLFHPIFKEYTIEVEGNSYYPFEFLKLLRNTKDGASGEGVTVQLSQAIETAYQTMIYQLGLVKKGGNKRGFLKSQRKLGQDEIDVLKQAWKNLYSNDEESVVVLNNGLEFQEASNTSVEMQLNESKKAFMDEINSIFHIYPNDFDRTFKEAIYPIVKAFETALNRDLLLEKEKKDHFFVFDVKEIIKASIKERYEAYKTAKETGFITLNEIRQEENLNYVEGLDVVNVGLGAVLYDVKTHTYYTPNIDSQTDLNKTESMLESHVAEQEFTADGNSADA